MTGNNDYQLSAADSSILAGYKLVVDAIGQVFGNSCECVLHSLSDMEHSVIHIHNGEKTGRRIGSPVTDKALSLLKNCEASHHDVTPAYLTESLDGHPMRSTTLIIRNAQRIPIGFLCINFDLGTPLLEFCQGLMQSLPQLPSMETAQKIEPSTGKAETFVQSIDDLLPPAAERIRSEIYADASIPARSKTKAIILRLNQEGFFQLRSSVGRIAKILNISTDAIYLHLRALKKSQK